VPAAYLDRKGLFVMAGLAPIPMPNSGVPLPGQQGRQAMYRPRPCHDGPDRGGNVWRVCVLHPAAQEVNQFTF